uniref:Cytochrome P450 n=1 Tax=Rhabditophanes sp. KR3021 TaxID=114890 RepID=A0AC35TKE2_9BILA
MVLLVLTIILGFVVLYVLQFYKKVYSLPKGPFPVPLIGNVHLFNPAELHKWILEQRKIYGSVFSIYIANPYVVLSDVKSIKEALVTNGEWFAGRQQQFPETMMHDAVDVGVIMSSGDMWQAQRRLTLKIMRDFGMGRPMMEDKILLAINDLTQHMDSLADKDHVDFPSIIHLTIGNIINSITFGFMYPFNDAKEFYNFTHIVDETMNSSCRWEFKVLSMFPKLANYSIVKNGIFRSFFSQNKELRRINSERVAKAKACFKPNEEPQNFVHAALREINSVDSNYNFLDDTHITGMTFDMYLAGQETSTTTTKWFILMLMKYPEVQQKVFEEIFNAVGLENEIKLSHKNQLPYTMAFINEAQRYCNIVPLVPGHLCTKDTTIQGHFIPKGTVVQPFFYGSNYDETVFEEPYEFKPERFLLEDGKTLNKQLYDQMYSFGRGARVCAGQSLAMMELQVRIINK